MTVRIQTEAIDAPRLLSAFTAGRRDAGAVVSFTGLVRASTDGTAVTRLELDAYPGFTEPAIETLAAETAGRFAILDALVVHRHGVVEPGEAVVFVACAAVHRREAFQAADFLMDRLKTEAPFWKKEHGPDGERWIEPRAADYQDAGRWDGASSVDPLASDEGDWSSPSTADDHPTRANLWETS